MSTNPSSDPASKAEEIPPSTSAPSGITDQPRPKFRIAIGSQRDVADPKLAARRAPRNPDVPAAPSAEPARKKETASNPDTAETTAAQPTLETVQPSADQPTAVSISAEPGESSIAHELTAKIDKACIQVAQVVDDIESEIAAALAGFTMEQVIDRSSESTAIATLELGSRMKAFVSRVEGDHVFFQLAGRHEGIAPLRQFRKPPEPGSLVEIIVKSFHEEDGFYELSIPGAAVDSSDWSSLSVGDIVEARVTGSNTGGLEVTVNQLRGFIPASQIDRVRVEHFGDYVNQKLKCLVTEIHPGRRKLILSRRALLEREFEEQRRQRLAEIQVGETYEGLVTRLTDFGAFVDLGGVEGLVHVSKLSWGHVKHPRDVVEVGQRIRVKVEKANPETGKFSLSLRDTTPHPWHRAAERFPVGSVVTGTVTRIAQFGAFVKLDHGIEGLIHISELSHSRVASVGQVVKENQQVNVKILSLDEAAQRISLSLKATLPEPSEPQREAPQEEKALPSREYAVQKPSQPLRGGKGRDSGGQRFGLNL